MTRSLRIALGVLLLGSGSLSAAQAADDRPALHIDGEGQNTKQGPSAKTEPETPAASVFVDGALAVPGAPVDSQTRPAKFSAANDADDKIPILARGPRLTDDQKKLIAEALKQSPTSPPGVAAAPTMELPASVGLQEWPSGVLDQVPAVTGTKYVHFADRIVIVEPTNRIVIGEIAQ